MNNNKYSKKRIDKIKQLTKSLNRRLKTFQASLFLELIEVIGDLKTDSKGRIKFTEGNLKKGDRVSLIIERFNKANSSGLKDWLIKRFLDIIGLNDLYFKEIKTVESTVKEKTNKLIMKRLGYDIDTEEVRPNSYIDVLVNNSQFATNLAISINQAISSGIPLKDFQQQVQGQLRKQRAFDIFMQVDRQAALLYAEELNLKYLIWNNSPKKTTTDFCRDRAGNVYSIEEVNAWDSEIWKGKFEFNHRTIIDGHGYGCRTGLDFISNTLAYRLRPELKP